MAQVLITGGNIEHARMTGLRLKSETRTAAGNITLTKDSPTLQMIDPGGAGRDVTLPAEANSEGLVFVISNEADAAEALTVKSDAPATVVTVAQNEGALVWCDGTTWRGLVGANT